MGLLGCDGDIAVARLHRLGGKLLAASYGFSRLMWIGLSAIKQL